MRSRAAAVVAGYLVFAASTAAFFALGGLDPRIRPGIPGLLLTFVYVAAVSAIAGFVAAVVPRPGPRWGPSAVLAATLAVIALASAAAEWRAGSVWSQLFVICVAAPAIVAGGLFATRSNGSG